MQLAGFLVILIMLGTIAVIGALAIMQARRFRYLSKPSQIITWAYAFISVILAIAIIVSYFTIEF